MNIPFHSPPFIDQSVIDQVLGTLNSKWVTSGPKVKEIELDMLTLTGSKASVCVNSWTSGAIMMLKWFDVKEGDEVIIPSYSYCATALCVLHCGARPVMVDILDDFTIDPAEIKKAITRKTKAIIAVDFAGIPCNYDAIKAAIKDPDVRHLFNPESEKQILLDRILLISDAAHSIGTVYGELPSAQKADITIFSFHAVKNITTAEGGCICLNLPEVFDNYEEYSCLKRVSLNGQTKDTSTKSMGANGGNDIMFKGLKSNMPDIFAAIGLSQIRQYSDILLPLRKKIVEKYCDKFKLFDGFISPYFKEIGRKSSYHFFPLRIKSIVEIDRNQIAKRIFDIFFSLTGIIIILPLLFIISIAISLDSKGGFIYSQTRVGRNKSNFKLYKFRTMTQEADKGSLLTIGKDNRITKIGFWLRKYKIDELPQLFNVLKGDMSLVGPRPQVIKYVELYDLGQQRVLSVKPGLTDWASIYYIDENQLLASAENPESFYIKYIIPHKLTLNIQYIDHHNLWIDMKIILLTIKNIVSR